MFEAGGTVWFSPASAYEIALKHRLGRLPEARTLLASFETMLVGAGWQELPILSAHMQTAGTLPLDHRDPFDRILAAQALTDGLTLVSRDAALDQFGVRRLW